MAPLFGVLLFELDGARHALRLADVREVVRSVTITPLPGAPDGVEGVFDLHGVLVPVLDVRRRFRLPEKAVGEGDHFIVAGTGERAVAIRVDEATGVLEIDERVVETAREVGSRAEHLAGIARLPDGLVVIHDLERFLSGEEERVLAAALSAPGAGGSA